MSRRASPFPSASSPRNRCSRWRPPRRNCRSASTEISMRPFGKLEDGRGVESITLGDPQGLQVEVLTYGAILRRLTYPVRGQRRDLILSPVSYTHLTLPTSDLV